MIFLIIAAAGLTLASSSHLLKPPGRITFVDLRNLHLRPPRQTLDNPYLQNNYQTPDLGLYDKLIQNPYKPIPIPVHSYAPIPIELGEAQEQIPVNSNKQDVKKAAEIKPPDFGEYIDFGAHTGDNGAFGWYADYPLNNDGSYHHHRH